MKPETLPVPNKPTSVGDAVPGNPKRRSFIGRFLANYGLMIVALSLLASVAYASATDVRSGSGGGDGGEAAFGGIYGTIRGWITGTLGKLLAVAAFLVGMGIGVVKQSVMAIVIGIAFALVLAYGPVLIEGVFSFGLI